MTFTPWRAGPLLAVLLLAGVPARGQMDLSTGEAPRTNGNGQPTLFRMPGVFEIEMPKTESRGQVTFNFQPHFRDFLDQAYLRVPLEFRWGVNDHWELNCTAESYLDHGLRSGNTGYGFSQLHFGTKYAWHLWLRPTWDTSVGFDSSIPVSRPPIELTDGHNHFSPFITLGRKIDDIKGLSGFINASLDFIGKSSTPGNFGRNEPHSNSMTLRPGILYDHGPWHYTCEVGGTTTRLIGSGSKDFLTVRPGVFWDLPKKLVFNARGRWVAGLYVTATFGPDGNTLSTGGRFRGEVNLTRLFSRNPQEPPPPPPPTTANPPSP